MAKKRVCRENFDGEYYRQKYSNPANMNKAVAGIAQTAADEWKEYFTRERKGARGKTVRSADQHNERGHNVGKKRRVS